MRFFIGCTYSICVVGVAFSVFVATLFVLYYLYVQNVATIEKTDRKCGHKSISIESVVDRLPQVWPQIQILYVQIVASYIQIIVQ